MPAYLKFKPSAVVSRQAIIAAAAINAFHALGIDADCTITSGNDSKHKAGSLHYQNRALDIRTKTLALTQKHNFLAAFRARLGSDYDVILEDEGGPNEHCHAEYDPK